MTYWALLICFIASVLLTPVVKRFAFFVGATDKPNQRKVHQKIMPRLGGLAIFLSFLIGVLIVQPASQYTVPIVLGAIVIIITGVFDDIFELSPKVKLLGQIIAAGIVIYGGVEVHFINLPFDYRLSLGILGVPLTLLWIIGITNAINLIDGLDGLAAGVSSTVLITISGMAVYNGNVLVAALGIILLGSTLGFLVYNWHPAKIFMGDTGALFLGYMIAVLSLLGFKNITLFSLVVPIIILGVPISDTLFAIIRRFLNKKPLSAPDKSHLHHCLLNSGMSHRQTVLVIYAMSALFGLAAILFNLTTLWGSLLILSVLLLITQFIAERIGLVGKDHAPVNKFLRKIFYTLKAANPRVGK
ncbi:UDP-GlcNAc:undecaprenyl-phosphate GlcNAc-1-phosphate transferase [Fictibacillus halophilus]|uniref:UDP-GlcNAc:undecaprenyl-phosphate GlcNAc-1-phosphate transferase n=1 Tax=Fictibacillus halophilus TaxID=1610490 RepID=A0ABV2LHF0_9BACL|nr:MULTISPECIES: MraY family glycosyltransferase [Fictibacillus]MED1862448.1 MraY family glycosyltransferase [Fictibacillus nanhaiensis]